MRASPLPAVAYATVLAAALLRSPVPAPAAPLGTCDEEYRARLDATIEAIENKEIVYYSLPGYDRPVPISREDFEFNMVAAVFILSAPPNPNPDVPGNFYFDEEEIRRIARETRRTTLGMQRLLEEELARVEECLAERGERPEELACKPSGGAPPGEEPPSPGLGLDEQMGYEEMTDAECVQAFGRPCDRDGAQEPVPESLFDRKDECQVRDWLDADWRIDVPGYLSGTLEVDEVNKRWEGIHFEVVGRFWKSGDRVPVDASGEYQDGEVTIRFSTPQWPRVRLDGSLDPFTGEMTGDALLMDRGRNTEARWSAERE